MFIALSFVGKLPSYIVECLHQIRCFFTGDVYLIINDICSSYISSIEKYNIHIINYDDVKSEDFLNSVSKNYSQFTIVHRLKGREQIFIRSFERFFLLINLMKNRELEDAFFMELDNLIYDDPTKWLDEFRKNETCFMFDNIGRCSSGIMYVKNKDSLTEYLDGIIHLIDESSTNNVFLEEMGELYRFYQRKKDTNKIQILPTYWLNDTLLNTDMPYKEYGKYGNSIFDAASMGVYFFGMDTYHSGGVIKTGVKHPWGLIDYTVHKYEWLIDSKGRRSPYVFDNTQNVWVKINNLHIHSKNLVSGLSLPL
jgi:hypothetical protein